MATIATQTESFKALVADLYGDRDPQPAPPAAPALLTQPLFADQVATVVALAHTALPLAGERIDRAAEIGLNIEKLSYGASYPKILP